MLLLNTTKSLRKQIICYGLNHEYSPQVLCVKGHSLQLMVVLGGGETFRGLSPFLSLLPWSECFTQPHEPQCHILPHHSSKVMGPTHGLNLCNHQAKPFPPFTTVMENLTIIPSKIFKVEVTSLVSSNLDQNVFFFYGGGV